MLQINAQANRSVFDLTKYSFYHKYYELQVLITINFKYAQINKRYSILNCIIGYAINSHNQKLYILFFILVSKSKYFVFWFLSKNE